MSTIATIARELLDAAAGTMDAVDRRPWPRISSTAYDLARVRTTEAIFDGRAQSVAKMTANATRSVAVVKVLAVRAPDLFTTDANAIRTVTP